MAKTALKFGLNPKTSPIATKTYYIIEFEPTILCILR